MKNHLLDVQHTLRAQGILISFSGRLSQGLIEEYGEAVKKYLETEDRPQNEIFNIFSIFIEQTQNIKNYGSGVAEHLIADRIAQSAIVTIGKSEDSSYVCSGNLIRRADIGPLAEHLNRIIGMDKTELKAFYKAVLKRETSDSHFGGAGLGLIDMARKSSRALQFDFAEMDEDMSFFTLKAMV